MEIDRKELKRLAREAMDLPSPRFWAVTLVYLLMTTGLSLALEPLASAPIDSDAPFSAVGFFLTILFTLYALVVSFGYDLWSLWTSRRLEPGLDSLIQGFQVAGRVVMVRLHIFLRLVGWAFLIALALMPVMLSSYTLAALLFPVSSALLWVVMLRYALANYLLADRPDDGPAAAVQRSAQLMRGWKWELFKLEFSFFGWDLLKALLSGLALAILLTQAGFFQAAAQLSPADLLQGSSPQLESVMLLFQSVSDGYLCAVLTALATLPLVLWLTPYRSVTRAAFYDARLRLQRESAAQMPPL